MRDDTQRWLRSRGRSVRASCPGCSRGGHRVSFDANMANAASRSFDPGVMVRMARSALTIAIAAVMVMVLLSPGVGHASGGSGVGPSVAAGALSLDPGANSEAGAQCSCQVGAPQSAQHLNFSPDISPLSFVRVNDPHVADRTSSPPTRPPRG